MKTLKFLIPIIIFVACSSGETNNKKMQNIMVSILPQKYFVEKIVGDSFNVDVMIPPGASPVTYDPTPRQMRALSNSFVYFRIGHIEFEKSWIKKLKGVNASMDIIDLSKNATLIEPEHNHDHSHTHNGHHHHHGVDPHIWLSPKEVKKQAKIIYDYLVKTKPEYKNQFEINYNQFSNEIKQLDAYMTSQLKDYKGRKFLIFHPALTYIARDYGLQQISIEIDGKEPTPANIQKIISTAKNEKIKIVFAQKQFSISNAEIIAREIGGKVKRVDPLAYNWDQGVRFITDEIVKSYSK
ncbi:MAG: zinc ABC transporter substrate-binding protein [Bacteroidales bacterium]|nr:zinc ABC transporter substrate-binding protein [Bacteroidales bacterium]